MRIGIMLRALQEKGGVGVYTHNITKELLEIDQDNQYFLYYRDPESLGRFRHYKNANERVLPAPSKALWDQVRIPIACIKDKIDVLFHPKFSVPLFAPCKTVMVLHGAGWFMPDHQKFWSASDLRYARLAMPLYCRRASAVLSVSQITTDTFNRVFRLPPGKIKTVYFAPGRQFQPITDKQALEQVRVKYGLPERFILTLSGYDRGDRKNIAGILKGYQIHHGKTPHHLVIVGKDCHRFREDYGIPTTGYGADIHFTGWIDQQDLPAVYSLADLFLYPSNVEAFPIPVTEALACGTPIITSNANGLREIVGDAALFVDPKDHEAIGSALGQALTCPELLQELAEKGINRSAMFRWEKCASQTLQILTQQVKRS